MLSTQLHQETSQRPQYLILAMTPTHAALALLRDLAAEGYTFEQIWSVISVRLARLIECHYSFSALAEPVSGLSHLFPRIDSILGQILPRVNLAEMIHRTVGHTDVCMDVVAKGWRLQMRLDYFPY